MTKLGSLKDLRYLLYLGLHYSLFINIFLKKLSPCKKMTVVTMPIHLQLVNHIFHSQCAYRKFSIRIPNTYLESWFIPLIRKNVKIDRIRVICPSIWLKRSGTWLIFISSSELAQSSVVWLFVIPWTTASQASFAYHQLSYRIHLHIEDIQIISGSVISFSTCLQSSEHQVF